jgi:hypothetical protein
LVVVGALAGREAFAAGAPPDRAALDVRRDESARECPDAPALAARVTRQFGRPAIVPAPAAGATTTFIVTFWREGGRLLGRLVATGARAGERTFTDESAGCEGLADALAATMAIAMREGVSRPVAPPPANVQPWGVWVEARAEASFNVVRALWPGASAFVGVRPRPWLGVGVGALVLPTAHLERSPGALDLTLIAAELRVCGHDPARPAFRLGLCVSTFAGELRGQGDGFTPDRSARGRWVALAGGPRLEGELFDRLGWLVHASAAIPVWADRFKVEGLGRIYEPPSVGALVGAGLLWSFR